MKFSWLCICLVVLIITAFFTINTCHAKPPDPCAKLVVNVKRSTDSAPISGANVKVTNWRGQSGNHTTNSAGQVFLDATNNSTNPVLTNTGYSSGKGKCARAVKSGKSFKVSARANVSGFAEGNGSTTLTNSSPHGEITIYLSPQSGGHEAYQSSSGATEIVVEVTLAKKAHYVYLYEVDSTSSSKWNPNGRYAVRTGDPIEQNGKYVYVINTIHPGNPRKVTQLGMLYKSGDVSQSRQRDVSLTLVRKRAVEAGGTTYYDVMFARFSE